jgi:HPt (histidine-containing phosphotransfer) domain-containing protein
MPPEDLAERRAGQVPDESAEPEPITVSRRLRELLGERSPAEQALVDRMVTNFGAKSERLIGEWARAVEAGDPEEAVRQVHTLTGTALNLGSVTLSRLCMDVEEWTARTPDQVLDRRPGLEAAAREFGVLLHATAAELTPAD